MVMNDKDRKRLQEHARALRAFAMEKNLFRVGARTIENVQSDAYTRTARTFEASAMEVLEKQAITAFGINEKRNTIYVYTQRRITKKDEKILPHQLTSNDINIEYRQAKPLSIGNEEAAPAFGVYPYTIFGVSYTCGSSISVGNERSAGTMGCLVKDENEIIYGLTNNHVVGGCNNTRFGMPVAAPGIMDVQVGNHDLFTIGWHSNIIPMRQGDPSAVDISANTDAAIFQIADPNAVSSMLGSEMDTPTEHADPEDDMVVKKVGRTTGYTTGFIESEIVGGYPVTYKSRTYHSPDDMSEFSGQVYFDPIYLIRGDRGLSHCQVTPVPWSLDVAMTVRM